ncbi:MAG: hypothetical protein WA989_16900 [Henriciella sp.]|uniref:hypothetical protein n=1 Tax=Henriciella sp. TaxID=1968823 RepID=UPI003C77664B
MQKSSGVNKILNHTAAHVAGAFLGMGSWAVFANSGHPLPDMALAGLVQGTLSGLITLVMKKCLEALSARFAGASAPLAIMAPPFTVCTVSTAVLIGTHALAGTPEILATIAVPASVALTYAIIYSYSLWRQRKGQTGKDGNRKVPA